VRSGGASLVAAAVLAGSALLAGCPGGGGGSAAPPAPPPGAPLITIEVADGLAFGETVPASLAIKNMADEPIALVGAVLKYESGAAARLDATTMEASLDASGKGSLSGSLWVEDLGAEGRAAMPPRWRMEGDARLATCPMLPPGATYTLEGTITPLDDAARALEATVFYARLSTETALIGISGPALEPIVAGGPEGATPGGPPVDASRGPAAFAGGRGREVAVARAKATLAPLAAVPPDASLEISWAIPDALRFGGAPPPRLFPCGLRKETTEALPLKGAQVTRILAMKRPAFDLPEARKAAGIAAGPALHVAGAWLLAPAPPGEGAAPAADQDRRAAYVTSTKAIRFAGNPRPLADALAKGESAHVLLYERAPKEDPDGTGAFLASKGVAVEHAAQKGGTVSGVARVTRDSLEAFLAAVSEKALALEGLRLARTGS